LDSTGSDDKMKLEIMSRVKSIPSTTGTNQFPVPVRVTAPPRYTGSSRAGLDLVAVLCISASMMADDRLDSMKQAMMFVIDNLGPNDRLSVVSFDHKTQRLTELSYMNDVNRAIAKHEVRKVQPGCGINTCLALDEAAKILRHEERINRVGRIFLLSDAEDESVFRHDVFPEFPVETFGLGAGHDSAALPYIAVKTMGVYSYVNHDLEKIKHAFAQSLGGLMSVTAMEVQVNLQTLDGITISSIRSGSYPMSISSDKPSGTIQVPDLYAGEQKNFIVYLDVPEGEQNQILTVSVSYQNPRIRREATTIQLDESKLAVLRPKVSTTPSDRLVCPDVATELVRLRLARLVMGKTNNIHRTPDQLQRSWDKIKCSKDGRSATQSAVLALDGDVAQMQRTGGKQFMHSWLTSHGLQRATTMESPSESPGTFRVKAMEEMIKKMDEEKANEVKIKFKDLKTVDESGERYSATVLLGTEGAMENAGVVTFTHSFLEH
ncbi:hypothetical protein EJB05_29063, partial [Eragrostis curvula]